MTLAKIDLSIQELQKQREKLFFNYRAAKTYNKLHDINSSLNDVEAELLEYCKKLDQEMDAIYKAKLNCIDNPQFIENVEALLTNAFKYLKYMEILIQKINWI